MILRALLLLALLAGLTGATDSARAVLFSQPATSPSACPANDGSAGAPSGSPQQPNLLNGYTTTIRSLGCQVAGVDYAVGYGSTSLTDWRTLSGTGITVNTTTGQVSYASNSSCSVNGVDFSLDGGASVNLTCANPTVTNSKFLCGSRCIASESIGMINMLTGCSGNITITNNDLNGGSQDSANQATVVSAGCSGAGTFNLKYNWIHNFSQQVLELNTSATLNYLYNLIQNGGFATGAHPNYMQLAGNGTITPTVQFNTTSQAPQVAGGEGFQLYDGVSGKITLNNAAVQYNTIIATGSNSMSYQIHGICHSSADCATTQSNLTGTGPVINNNYFDITGAFGAFYPTSGSNMWSGVTLSNNWNMVSGAPVAPAP